MARGDTAALTGADRVLATLKLLAGHSAGVSLEALAREMGAPKSSTHRALAALRRAGFAEQDERGRYRVGSELVRIAFDYHERRDEVDLVRPTSRVPRSSTSPRSSPSGRPSR
jgi:IclR family acetate operon transcriptional repressor